MKYVNNTVIGALALAPLLCACQPRGPTAKEIFELRSQCGKFREDAILESAKIGSFDQFQAHYDPASNRCYLYKTTSSGIQILKDGQTGSVFAVSVKGHSEIHNKTVTEQEFLAFVKKKMGDDFF